MEKNEFLAIIPCKGIKKERLPHKDWQLKINSYFCKVKFLR